MDTVLLPLRNASLEHLSSDDIDVVLANARTLRRATGAGQAATLLRGKKLGLMCESADSSEAMFFCRAAAELGAHVAHVRPGLSDLSRRDIFQHMARMLGRLYDAVECEGFDPILVKQLGEDAGVPVYDAIASAQHPTARLAPLLGDESSLDENRHLVLQAVLISTIG
jgi:ornithine carbamoyltransferase